MIASSEVGDNSDLIAHVAEIHLRQGDKVADVTYGKGVFWRKVDLTKYITRFSDLVTGPQLFDFRHLPYEDSTFDCVVLDPPYAHDPGELIMEANYKNAETTKGMCHNEILAFYLAGMKEGRRVLKVGGHLWVKCKDEVESSYQRWSHIEIYEKALELGFFAEDMFVLTQKNEAILQHEDQQHARKNHSYLWVFKKANPAETRKLRHMKIRAIMMAGAEEQGAKRKETCQLTLATGDVETSDDMMEVARGALGAVRNEGDAP